MKKLLLVISLFVLAIACKKEYYRVYSIKVNSNVYYISDTAKYKMIPVFYRLQIERQNGKFSCSPIVATKVLVDTSFKADTLGYKNSVCYEPILPLTLEYFYADGLKDSAKVLWKTRLNPDASNYVVQRSFDGAKFKSVAKIPLKENDSRYVYVDTVTKK